MRCCSSTRNQQSRHTPSTLTDDVCVSDPSLECTREENRADPKNRVQDVTLSPGSATPTDKSEDLMITRIRATDPALGLGRIPAGFYVVVHYNGLEWRTENKLVLVDSGAVEWNELIPIPSDPSASVSLAVQASFEFQPRLGNGEQLRELTTTVERLRNYSAEEHSFTFLQDDEHITSPCSSLQVTVGWQARKDNGLVASGALEPHLPAADSQGQLEDVTNQGHSALSRYRKLGELRDLEHAIEQFWRVLNICPLDHPCYAAAQSNLAMAKLIHCRVNTADAPLDVPLMLYRSALATRPVGHPDRARTLIQLAAVHSARFEKRRDPFDTVKANSLLREAMDLNSVGRHEYQAAVSALSSHSGHTIQPIQVEDHPPVQQGSASGLTNVDPWHQGFQLFNQFERFRNLAVSQQAISVPDTPLGSAGLGIASCHRYIRSGELSDLEEAILKLRNAVDFSPDHDPDVPRFLIILSSSLVTRFRRLDTLSDLEEAILRQRNAIQLTSDDHCHKPTRLTDLGTFLYSRFLYLGKPGDLEEAILRQRSAVDLTPNGHPDKLNRLHSFSDILFTRFERFGELSDLEEVISTQRNAARLVLDARPRKPVLLDSLANSLLARFQRLRGLNALDEAISTLRKALDLTPDRHPHRPRRLNSLGSSLLTRFENFGEPSDLEEAIARQRDAAHLVSDGHRQKPLFLDGLANSFRIRFRRLGELCDLEEAILMQRSAVDLTPNGHPGMSSRLNKLGVYLLTRFERLGQLGDLTEAISKQQDAIRLCPNDHSHMRTFMNSLANSFLSRFQSFGELRDLEEAILNQRKALELIPGDHSDRPQLLSTIGTSLLTRFERLGDLDDLREAISKQQDAIRHIDDGHPRKPLFLTGLGNSFFARFRRFSDLGDLEEAILTQSKAIDLIPSDHPDKSSYLSNLAISLRNRFDRLGKLSDLEEAISKQRDAVRLIPDGHPQKPSRLNNLSISLSSRFHRLGKLSDLDEAISSQGKAVDLTHDSHPDMPKRLDNLGIAFKNRFEFLGNLGDLEEAILKQTKAVHLVPEGHPSRPGFLNGLANSLIIRFERLGELNDLKEAISKQQDVVRLTPDGHPDRPARLDNLSVCFLARFKHLGELSDLEEAISWLRTAVDLTPDGDPNRPARLYNLSSSITNRFRHLDEWSDLEEAILMQRDAVLLTPVDHPERPNHLNHLGISLRVRFEHLEELSDLEEAISRQKDAVDLTPDDHPQKPNFLKALGDVLITRFRHLGELRDLQHAVLSYSRAASAPVGSVTVRFIASRLWISSVRLLRWRALLEPRSITIIPRNQGHLRACSVAIHLLPQLAWIGLSLAHRCRELIKASDVVREAAAAALDAKRPETAVEWLEQGRSIIWGEQFQLRSSYDELASVYPDHARRLRELSTALEHASAARERSLSVRTEQVYNSEHFRTESLQQEADRHRRLAIDRDALLQEIQRLPGFEQSLLQKEYSQLRASAHSGPVVILNAAESRCDALIVLADVDHPIHVPLSKFTLRRSMDFRASLKRFFRRAGAARGDRDGQLVSQSGDRWESILASLWICVVKPVLDSLAFSTPIGLSRIFWCPTGPFAFLPIHAAGLYDTHHSQPGHKVYDFVVSSYVPTLSILTPSLKPDPASDRDLRLLAVPQPPSDGQSQLPGVVAELEHIRTAIRNTPSTQITLTESSAGTVGEILVLMKETDWVHFACHGIQDTQNPTESGLCLADRRRLTLSDAISLSRPLGGLAFLSACQTAKGDDHLSDEAMHIAAGMLFAGYRGVIGTMWAISDKLAPEVARDVYEQLFRSNARPDYREAAKALHVAVGRLRERDIPFEDWLPFIHVGL